MPFRFTFQSLKIIAGEFTLSRGITPSIATLRILPQDLPSLAVGSMTITDDTTTLTFPNCAADFANIRKVEDRGGWRWHLQVKDRRWKWKGGNVTGRYNVRKGNGVVIAATQKTPAQLVSLLLDAMGETGYDVSDLPTGFYPSARWFNAEPAAELLRLCERFGFAICLRTDNTVAVVPYGTGAALPTGGELTGTWRLEPDTLPANVVAAAGPTRFQSRLTLQAVSINADGDIDPVASMTYEPASTWDYESPFFFSQVAAADRFQAFRGMWKYFRVSGQAAGGLAPAGADTVVADIAQIFPLDTELITSGQDASGNWIRLPPMIDGVFFAYSELPINSATGTAWNGPFAIDGDTGIVILETPAYYLGTGGIVEAPTLNLTTAYYITKGDTTDIEHASVTVAVVGGTGSDRVVKFPEAFAAITVTQSVPVSIAAENTTTAIEAELEAIRDSVADRYDTLQLLAVEYNGIRDISPDGKIAQVKWRGWCGRAASTGASQGFEFDVFNLSDADRNRRALVNALVEDGYVNSAR